MSGPASQMMRSETLPPSSPAQAAPQPSIPPRPIIVHYHLFKNAGTSLDRTLQANFGAAWDSFESDGPALSPPELRRYLLERPWVTVLSSHTALLPPPVLPDTKVIPILFVRHPLDRVRSIYDFEHKQQADTDGARAAKEMDIAGYVRWRLARKGDRAIVNFQTYRLAKGGSGADEPSRAADAVSKLPFVGLVEDYHKSLDRLQALLLPHFPRVQLKTARVNVTQTADAPLERKLEQLEERLGSDLFDALVEANRHDIALWEQVRAEYTVGTGQEIANER